MRKCVSELTIEELQLFKYPNLMAEAKETTYSIGTIADHMGLSKPYLEEDAGKIWDKLTGTSDMLASEAIGLARLFNVSLEYLFGSELIVDKGQTVAYWRWLDRKEQVKKEAERNRQVWEIERKLKENTYLLEFVKEVVDWSPEQLNRSVKLLERSKTA